MSVNSIALHGSPGVPAPAPTPSQPAQTTATTPAPKTDVIDLSKPPTPEQAERLRNAGILGYGTIHTSGATIYRFSSKGVIASGIPLTGPGIGHTEISLSGNQIGPGTHFSVDYSFEYFDLVNETVTRHASTTSGFFTENGFSAVSESLTVQTTFDEERYWRGQLGDTADKMAAARQVKASYLDAHFSGKERDDRLAKLDESYQAAKHEAVDSFTKMLGKLLKENDRSRFEEKTLGSVQAVFSHYEAKYQAAAAKHGFSSWASSSFYESTLNLQKLGASVTAGAKQGAWSMEELDFAAVSISAYHSALSAVQKGGNEAQYALHFSMTSMKVEVMASRNLIHSDLADMLRLSGQNAQKGGIFSAVSKQVMDHFHSSGDAMDAIRAGAERGGVPLPPKGYQNTFEAEWSSFTMEINSRQSRLSLLG